MTGSSQLGKLHLRGSGMVSHLHRKCFGLLFYGRGYLGQGVGWYIYGVRMDNGDWQLNLEVFAERDSNLDSFKRDQASRQF